MFRHWHLLAEHHLVEAVHLVGGADAQGGALVHGHDLDVQHGAAGDAVGGLAARHLDEEAEGGRLEGQAQLGGGLVGRGVGEDAHVLGELLVHVGHQAAGVAQRVLAVDVEVHQRLVARHLLPGAHVGRTEDLGVRLDLDLLAGADPGLERAVGQLAPLGRAAVAELVHAVVQRHQHGGAGAVQGDERRDLVAPRGAQQAVLAVAGLLAPHADHGAHGPVVVHDGGPVEGVPAHGEPPLGVARLDVGLLLGRAPRHHGGRPHGVPHDVVSDDVHGELRVPEGVLAALHGDQRRAQRLRDVRARVQLLLDHGAHLQVLALLVEHEVQGVIGLLLLGGGVEGGAGRAVLAAAAVHAHAAHRLGGSL
mmetsp:Transcript_22581/g.55772  ORF Transcript_22581/g.55772 Transcript_22581/m.55772 type:complete len:364 (-) Transcript_22581:126-1217(-)